MAKSDFAKDEDGNFGQEKEEWTLAIWVGVSSGKEVKGGAEKRICLGRAKRGLS